MLKEAAVISLQIVAIYACFLDGSVLGWLKIGVANVLDKTFGLRASRYIQKPLWDCLFCMASVWTIILSWSFDIKLILTVCGINFIISNFIKEDAVETKIDIEGFKSRLKKNPFFTEPKKDEGKGV